MRRLILIFYYLIAQNLPKSNFPLIGKLSCKIRGCLVKRLGVSVGNKITIERKVYLGNFANFKIGDFSGIGNNAKIYNTELEIGSYVMIGEDLIIQGGGHNFNDITKPMIFQGSKPKDKLTIDDDVWIGGRVIVLAKIDKIGKGSIIGAGSVVTKEVLPYTIVAGNPARVIGYRDK